LIALALKKLLFQKDTRLEIIDHGQIYLCQTVVLNIWLVVLTWTILQHEPLFDD